MDFKTFEYSLLNNASFNKNSAKKSKITKNSYHITNAYAAPAIRMQAGYFTSHNPELMYNMSAPLFGKLYEDIAGIQTANMLLYIVDYLNVVGDISKPKPKFNSNSNRKSIGTHYVDMPIHTLISDIRSNIPKILIKFPIKFSLFKVIVVIKNRKIANTIELHETGINKYVMIINPDKITMDRPRNEIIKTFKYNNNRYINNKSLKNGDLLVRSKFSEVDDYAIIFLIHLIAHIFNNIKYAIYLNIHVISNDSFSYLDIKSLISHLLKQKINLAFIKYPPS